VGNQPHKRGSGESRFGADHSKGEAEGAGAALINRCGRDELISGDTPGPSGMTGIRLPKIVKNWNDTRSQIQGRRRRQ